MEEALGAGQFGGNTRLRARCVELGLLPRLSLHELGWRRELALVGRVWRLGHPADADGDVAPLVEACYRATNPRSPLLAVLPIRADAAMRAEHAAARAPELEALADGRFDAEAAAAAVAEGHAAAQRGRRVVA